MNKKEHKAFAKEVAKSLETEKYFSNLSCRSSGLI
jgi:hypothetical protein